MNNSDVLKGWNDYLWLLPLAGLVLLLPAGLAIGLAAMLPAGLPTKAALSGGVLLLGGAVLLGYAVLQRLRDEARVRQELELQNLHLRESFNALPLGLAIYDQHDRLQLYNPEAAGQAPYRDGEGVVGQTYEALIRRSLERGEVPDARGREEDWLHERMAVRGKLKQPLLRYQPDGRWMHQYELGTPSGCLVMALVDVSELVQKSLALERSNGKLEQLAVTDALTGLANRRQFDRHLDGEWQRSLRYQHPVSLLMVDIDHFGRFNDRYGHPAGDDCLRQVASILFDCAQRSGELVARYGGEEFALLLPGSDSATALAVAQQCMDAIACAQIPHAGSGVSGRLTVSIGVATVVATHDLVPESLVRSADEALYQVKHSGRGQMQVAACPA